MNSLPALMIPADTGNPCETLWQGVFSADFRPVTCLTHHIDTVIGEVAGGASGRVAATLGTTLTTLATIAIILIGYGMLFGKNELTGLYNPFKAIVAIVAAAVIINNFEGVLYNPIHTLVMEVPVRIVEAVDLPASRAEARVSATATSEQDKLAGLIDVAFVNGLQSTLAVLTASVPVIGPGVLRLFLDDPEALGLENCTDPPPEGEDRNTIMTWLWEKFTYVISLEAVGDTLAGLAELAFGLILALIVLFSVLTWATYATSLYISNYLKLVLLLVLAPVFLGFFMFAQTRDITQKWCQNLISCALINLILMGMVRIFMLIIESTQVTIANPNGCHIDPFAGSIVLALMYLVLLAMTKNIPVIVSELTGSSGQGAGDVIGNTIRTAVAAGTGLTAKYSLWKRLGGAINPNRTTLGGRANTPGKP